MDCSGDKNNNDFRSDSDRFWDLDPIRVLDGLDWDEFFEQFRRPPSASPQSDSKKEEPK